MTEISLPSSIPSKTKVISFVGHERSGKDTIAEAVYQNLIIRGFKVKKFANANALKELACKLKSISLEELENLKASNEASWGSDVLTMMSMRDYLIHLSEDIIKPIFGQSVWADVFRNFCKNNSELDFIIKTDDRYEEDVKANDNVVYVSVNREGVTGLSSTPYYHFVNSLINKADVCIENNVDINSVDFRKYIHTMTLLIERQFGNHDRN
jgi:hypothetical protein